MVGAAEQAASWLRGVGVTWDDGAVEIRVHVGSSSSGGADASNAAPAAAQLAGATFPGYSGKAMGVWAVRDIKEGESLCRIPKKALLSIRNTEASDIIEEEDLGGGLGLVFAVLYEMCLAEKSRWHGYFQSMPEREYLPLFWTQEELGLLVGTDLGERAVADRELAQSDYDEDIKPLVDKYKGRLPADLMTFERFSDAASLVASRAFGVDGWHGEAMVPLADIFNHKASIVSLSDEYIVAEDTRQEEEEQESGGDDSDEAGDVEEEEEDCGDDDKDEMPMLFSAGQRPPPILGPDIDALASGLRLEIGICSLNEEDALQIIAASDIKCGAEVHNTYGEHGNAELVNKYGFALRDNPFDAVVLEKSSLVEAATQQLPTSAKDRTAFLLEHTALLDDDVEPLEVMAGSRLGASLVAALRVIGADDTDFEAWEAAGDAFPWLKANEAEGGGEEEPSWAKTGALALPANVLTQTAQKVLKGALDLEYKRRYGEEEPVVEEKQLATGQCTPAVRAALLLRLGEKKLLLAAGAALDADLGRNLEDEPPGKRAKH